MKRGVSQGTGVFGRRPHSPALLWSVIGVCHAIITQIEIIARQAVQRNAKEIGDSHRQIERGVFASAFQSFQALDDHHLCFGCLLP